MRRKAKTLIPNGLGDFLSILSFTGFISIFLIFTFGITILEENMTPIYLLLGGSAFLVVGKVFTLKKWIKDGIQRNEVSLLLSIVFGFSSIIISVMMFAGIELPTKFYGNVGIFALVPAIYTLVDYFAKNKN